MNESVKTYGTNDRKYKFGVEIWCIRWFQSQTFTHKFL